MRAAEAVAVHRVVHREAATVITTPRALFRRLPRPVDFLPAVRRVAVDEEPYETVGGLIFGRVGNVPEEGSEVETLGLVFRVESVIDRRIERLVVRAG